MTATAGPGPKGGLILHPRSVLERRDALLERVGEHHLHLSEAGLPLSDFARLVATTWDVSIEQGRRLTLPEGARRMGLVTGEGSIVVVFAGGGFLEIWPREEWIRHVREAAGDRHLLGRVEDTLYDIEP